MQKFDDARFQGRLSQFHGAEEERRIQALATQYGSDYIQLVGYTINPEAVAIIPEAEARRAAAVGFELKRDTFSLAALEPTNPDTVALVNKLQKQRYIVRVYMCSKHSLEHGFERYRDITTSTAEKKGVFEIDATEIAAFTEKIQDRSSVEQLLNAIKGTDNTRRVTETMEVIYAGALRLRVSDIHIEPEETAIRLRYRLDGVLQDIAMIDRSIYSRLISRLKLLSGMTLNKKNEAQDGRFTFDVGEKQVEVRSSVIPGANGESIVMRLLDPTVASFNMSALNLNPYIYAAMEHELKKPNGLIITTGPTGSGKTTALYAFLRETHKEGIKIITIENPVEYKLQGIVQTQTGDDYTFASGLRAILRQDPDVIMVGEIRDREVAETAIHAAQTGHLVFSTLHTNSAAAAFPRLIDLGIDARIFGSSINIMLGQRLVRKLCEHCLETYEASTEERAILTEIYKTHPYPATLSEPLILARPRGCEKCSHTGFKGRASIFEGIIVDQAVEDVLVRDPREHLIVEAAAPQKIPTMLHDGADKVVAHITSLAELERIIELPVVHTENLGDTPPNPSEADFLAHVVTD